MIISDEQVQLALEYLQDTRGDGGRCSTGGAACDVSDLVERVRLELEDLPDTREDRMAEARRALDQEGISAEDVAGKMLGRAVSDSIR